MGIENVSSEHHLSGSYGFISQGLRLIGRDLFSAGFWNYLREDITVALMKKRPLKIDLTTIQAPTELIEDDDWANHITYLLGNIINQCLGSDMMATNTEQWSALMTEVQAWHRSLPSSYTAISPNNTQSSFPTLWLLNGWHSKYSRCDNKMSTNASPSRRLDILLCLDGHTSPLRADSNGGKRLGTHPAQTRSQSRHRSLHRETLRYRHLERKRLGPDQRSGSYFIL